MAIPDAYRAITLAEFNVGAAAATTLLNPLAAQLDALLALGIGPFQAALSAQLSASIALQAQLSLSLSLGIAADLRLAISAAAQLQAQLTAALALGISVNASITSQFSASIALAAALKAQLGGLQAVIKAALAVKIPAIRAAADYKAALSVGPFFAVSFSGVQLQNVSSWLSAQVSGGGLAADGEQLLPTQQTYGVFVFGTNPSFQAQFGAIISVPTP